jgi:hypothetical protein
MNDKLAQQCDRMNRIGAAIAVWSTVALVMLAAIVANVTAH